MAKKKIIRDLDTNQIFRSLDELYISWYLEELKQKGYILEWSYEAKTYELAKGEELIKKIEYEKLKTKVKEKLSYPMLLGKHEYTPDFEVVFKEESKNLFYNNHNAVYVKTIPFILYNSLISTIEVKFEKGKYSGSKAKTNISRKFLLEKHGIYAQELRYKELFHSTFSPERYLSKDNKRMSKQIRFPNNLAKRSLDEYIKIRKNLNSKIRTLRKEYLNQQNETT
jgi:hypothetical protein